MELKCQLWLPPFATPLLRVRKCVCKSEIESKNLKEKHMAWCNPATLGEILKLHVNPNTSKCLKSSMMKQSLVTTSCNNNLIKATVCVFLWLRSPYTVKWVELAVVKYITVVTTMDTCTCAFTLLNQCTIRMIVKPIFQGQKYKIMKLKMAFVCYHQTLYFGRSTMFRHYIYKMHLVINISN